MPFQPMAFGQAEQGTITGAVKDTSGAVVRGAKVNATAHTSMSATLISTPMAGIPTT
jgi:hypothetical protein